MNDKKTTTTFHKDLWKNIYQWPVTDVRGRCLVAVGIKYSWPMSRNRDWRLITIVFKYLTQPRLREINHDYGTWAIVLCSQGYFAITTDIHKKIKVIKRQPRLRDAGHRYFLAAVTRRRQRIRDVGHGYPWPVPSVFFHATNKTCVHMMSTKLVVMVTYLHKRTTI